MNNQDVSVEQFVRVSSIEHRVSYIEYQLECQLTFSRYCTYVYAKTFVLHVGDKKMLTIQKVNHCQNVNYCVKVMCLVKS